MKRLIKKAEKTIKLMHGTSSVFINDIIQKGLLPEGYTGNAMFTYNDYGRKGEPKHADCVYLTNDLENATLYANNAVKRNEGFPIIIEVEVKTDSLIWDDDAFYKNYGDFDFGEKDDETGEWIKKPKKELWEQSLDINMQCAHYGKIEKELFIKFFINDKWYSIDDFISIFNNFNKLDLQIDILEDNIEYSIKDFSFSLVDYFNFKVKIIKRRIYFYDFQLYKEADNNLEKQAISLKIMEGLKLNIKEFGAKIIYTPEFKKIDFNPKLSSFNYVFGSFEIKSVESINEDLRMKIDSNDRDISILKEIVNCKATEEDFISLYEYAVDFVGDIVDYCENILKYTTEKTIEVLKNIKDNYKDSYNQIQPEIEYLQIKLMK